MKMQMTTNSRNSLVEREFGHFIKKPGNMFKVHKLSGRVEKWRHIGGRVEVLQSGEDSQKIRKKDQVVNAQIKA